MGRDRALSSLILRCEPSITHNISARNRMGEPRRTHQRHYCALRSVFLTQAAVSMAFQFLGGMAKTSLILRCEPSTTHKTLARNRMGEPRRTHQRHHCALRSVVLTQAAVSMAFQFLGGMAKTSLILRCEPSITHKTLARNRMGEPRRTHNNHHPRAIRASRPPRRRPPLAAPSPGALTAVGAAIAWPPSAGL